MSQTKRANRSVAAMFRASLFWAIMGAILSFAVADLNPAYFVIFATGAIGAWFGSVRASRPAHRAMINSVLLLVVSIAGIETLRSGVGVSAFAVFVALLLVVKLLDLRGPRDDGQVLVLCLSIMVAAVLTSNSFLTGALMLIESVLLLRAFVLFQVYSVVRLGRTPGARADRRTRIDMRSMILGAGFLCAIVAGMIFIVLPRNVGNRAFGQWGAGGSVSGFTDQVELGRPGRISMSPTPVLDLTIRDRNGQNVGAENAPPVYLRGAVLEEYEDGRWKRSSIMSVPLTDRIRFLPANASLKPRGTFDNTRWDHEYEISMRDVSDGPVYLFAPWRPVEFRVLAQPIRMGFDFNRGLFLKDGIGSTTLEYAIRAVNDAFRTPVFTTESTRRFVDQESIDPEIATLAYEIVREGGVEPNPAERPLQQDAAAVRLLETHLRTHYAYTLDEQPVPRGEDATEWFLFERREGHCEYYASALTLMCRAIGIPARVITGYIASDFNAVTGQYLVRESNAHAWIEAEIAPGLWRTFDGTPPSDFHDIHVPDPGLMRSVAKMYESLEFLWGRLVVGYDSDARDQIMGDRVGDFGLSSLSDRLLERFAAGRTKLVSRAAIIALIVFMISMFIGIGLLRIHSIMDAVNRFLRALFARLGISFAAGSARVSEIERLEQVVDSTLQRSGIPRPAWRPLRGHLEEHEEELGGQPELYASLRNAMSLIYLDRFSIGVTPNADLVGGLIDEIRTSENTGSMHSPNRQ
jgi:transglutaminase-like putative cysteine protease